MTDDLTAWLRAQLDEDERLIERNAGDRGLTDAGIFPDYRTYDGEDLDAACDYIVEFNPTRLRAEVAAKRAILAECERPDRLGRMRRIMLMLAQPYAGRPGWREEWRA